MIIDLKTKIIVALMMIIGALAVFIHFDHKSNQSQRPAENQWTPAPASTASDTGKEMVQPKQVAVLPQSAKQKLDLPSQVQNDSNVVVVDSTTLNPSDNPESVALTLDKQTGETQLITKEEPAPWFAIQHRSYVELDYGYVLNGMRKTSQLSFAHDFLRIKDFTFVGTAAVNNFGDTSAMIGVRYAF